MRQSSHYTVHIIKRSKEPGRKLKLNVSVFLTYGRDGGYNLTELQFVQDSCLASSVQAN